MVGPAGSDPASAAFQAAANPSQLETHSREAGTRTPSTWSQARCANPYATSREWTAPDLNREPSPCEGVALPLELAAHAIRGACGSRTRDLLPAEQARCHLRQGPIDAPGPAPANAGRYRGLMLTLLSCHF